MNTAEERQTGPGVSRSRPEAALAEERSVPSNERKRRKVRATFLLSAELLDELRDAVVELSGPPDRLTLSDLAEGALRREVERLKRVHRSGKSFAKRSQELRGGRPIR